VVVAAVEEFLFRGVALGLAARAFGRWPAALAVSLVFAGVHFLKPAKQADAVVHWWTGFAQIPRIFEAAPPPVTFAFGFASLFVAGMVLALAALRTRSLWLPVGIHAGWILGQQGFQWLARPVEKSFASFLPWVGPNVVSGAVPTGFVPLIVLLLTGAAVWLYLRYARTTASRPS
jgi:membrane protease YdiL (CAAX protease family)